MCTVHLDGILKHKICVILLHYTDKINHTYRFEMSTFFREFIKNLVNRWGTYLHKKKQTIFISNLL